MPQTLRTFLRKIGILKPCPVKHYRKEDLDFIFGLYNTDNFTKPFEQGENLHLFHNQILTLHKNLRAHRDAVEENNSSQANKVFHNLGILAKMGDVLRYDIDNWKCFTIDALRYNCSEAINDLLDEYKYEDSISNHRLFVESAFVMSDGKSYKLESDEWKNNKLNEAKQFLKQHRSQASIADDYYKALQNNRLYQH